LCGLDDLPDGGARGLLRQGNDDRVFAVRRGNVVNVWLNDCPHNHRPLAYRQHRVLSAGEKLGRAALYCGIAERMQAHGFAQRLAMYRRSLELFASARALARENCERVEIPYHGVRLSGLLVRAEGLAPGARAPTVVVMNGLDSTKEMLQKSVMGSLFARRGLATLFVDQPGTGEALRLHGLTAVANTEVWASPIVDWLQQRADVDARRIGGMCAAIQLRKQGIAVDLVGLTPGWTVYGAGITISGPSLRALPTS